MTITNADLQAKVEQIVEQHRLPGAVAAIWQDGQYAEAATGIRNVNTGDPMTPDTSFITGSVTKVWTTTLLMTLVDEGLIDLDCPIIKYAPDIQFGADPDVARNLTIKHLVNHSSGVDVGDLFVASREYPDGVEDYVEPISRAGKLTAPGVWASYNNIGWIVLELVLRRITGRNYHQLLTDRILDPLEIPRTVLSIADAALHRTTVGSFPVGFGQHEATPQLLFPSAWSPAGTTLITTVADTVKFFRSHLDGGITPDGYRLLTHASAEAMTIPTIQDPTGPQSGFGLGWRFAQRDRPQVLFHAGTSIGGRTFALISPADNLVLASHANSSEGDLFHRDLANSLVEKGSSPFAPLTGEVRNDIELSPFVGSYYRRGERVDIEATPDGLKLTTTPLPEDSVGYDVPEAAKITVVALRPTGPDSVRTFPTDPYQMPTDITFYERDKTGFNLMYSEMRLARRSRDHH